MRIAKSLMERPRARPKIASWTPGEPATDHRLARMHELIRAGQTEEALRIGIDALEEADGGPLVELARHCAQHGPARVALELVAIVADVRPDIVSSLADERAFRALRDDPRFLQMAGRL